MAFSSKATSQLKAFLKLAGASSRPLPLKTHCYGELSEYAPRHASGTPSVTFAKAWAATCGIISVASLLGKRLSVAALCLSELSIACHSGIVAVLYKFILRDHMLKGSCGLPEHPGRETLTG